MINIDINKREIECVVHVMYALNVVEKMYLLVILIHIIIYISMI